MKGGQQQSELALVLGNWLVLYCIDDRIEQLNKGYDTHEGLRCPPNIQVASKKWYNMQKIRKTKQQKTQHRNNIIG
eukprot:scaffold378_cov270-Chaetoceros_neogracile.AAC.9